MAKDGDESKSDNEQTTIENKIDAKQARVWLNTYIKNLSRKELANMPGDDTLTNIRNHFDKDMNVNSRDLIKNIDKFEKKIAQNNKGGYLSAPIRNYRMQQARAEFLGESNPFKTFIKTITSPFIDVSASKQTQQNEAWLSLTKHFDPDPGRWESLSHIPRRLELGANEVLPPKEGKKPKIKVEVSEAAKSVIAEVTKDITLVSDSELNPPSIRQDMGTKANNNTLKEQKGNSKLTR